ncbi:peptidase S58 family protein [Bosea caraganae]|uniref:Peptidase S58 family protein n=1 Tax=Bosea caraganae TaxID=2763117 RepID=A0A370LCS5_9HYPH|nr:P1 family peptidase [Bosea caraganae]RDJ27309.1 peptidase S58 family protein [Bosea caraganae]RDJ29325.1 peptidase S58 family protein [Bosea caraganae]
MRNLITDVRGLLIGQAHDPVAATGVSVALFERPTVASIAILGGAPGTRDTALLEPEMTVEHVDAIVLSGGSAWGVSAADGVMAALAERGRGFPVGGLRIPIVPQAILFDLLNGGDKSWAKGGSAEPPYRALGRAAVEAAALDVALGTAGAGYGATTATLKGGLGSASARAATGQIVGALVAVNAVGSATIGDGPHFWAAPYERDAEFGGRGWPAAITPGDLGLRFKGGTGQNTTIAIVATDAALTKAQAKRLALAAHDGLARALRPAHAPLDGDIVFAAATGHSGAPSDAFALAELCSTAADVLARAVARGVHAAAALPFPNAKPSWRDRFAS